MWRPKLTVLAVLIATSSLTGCSPSSEALGEASGDLHAGYVAERLPRRYS